MFQSRHWIVQPDVEIPDWLRESIGEQRFLSDLLARKGFESSEQLEAFLDPGKYTPSAPESMPDLVPAVERIEAALDRGETICVWGDFDVDGQTATTLLVSSLRDLGGNVNFYIPVRERESHGISPPALERVLARGVDLLLTCDTGITGHRAVDIARRQGVDVIITDHHDLGMNLPRARAVVNPKRMHSSYPAYHLPGVGVAYKVVQALMERVGREEQLNPLLDLVALGIVADLAIQRDDVRFLLQRGLQILKATQRPGLLALMEFAGLEAGRVNEEHIGFSLAPRLNALGRLADANPVVPFLLSRDKEHARSFASSLEGLNERRKLLTEQVFLAAEERLARSPDRLQDDVLVLEGRGWPAGIVGLVANRLVKRYQKPVVLITIDEQGVAHGSARSIDGIDISAAIAAQEALLDSFGGHPMAAGLRLPARRIPAFRRGLAEDVADAMRGQDLAQPLLVEAQIRLEDIGPELVNAVERLAPFGPGNPLPVFSARDLEVRSERRFGRAGEHRSLELVEEGAGVCTVYWWNAGDEEAPEGRFDLAFHVREDTYRGEDEARVVWVAAKDIERADIKPHPPLGEIRVVDLRAVDNFRRVAALRVEAGAQAWVEGMRVDWPAHARGELARCDELLIWTAPPGIDELRQGLAAADPQVVHFLGVAGDLDSIDVFLKRLSGMLKFAFRTKRGRVDLAEVSAALGHKRTTIREGIAWLAARGHITIHSESQDVIGIRRGEGVAPNPDADTHRLQAILAESAAFRRYLWEIDLESLRRLLAAVRS